VPAVEDFAKAGSLHKEMKHLTTNQCVVTCFVQTHWSPRMFFGFEGAKNVYFVVKINIILLVNAPHEMIKVSVGNHDLYDVETYFSNQRHDIKTA
jgi:hypothetical protein